MDGEVRHLVGLLLGTDVGPIVTPWASLATLLWYERCRAGGVRISWPRFMLTRTLMVGCAAGEGHLDGHDEFV